MISNTLFSRCGSNSQALEDLDKCKPGQKLLHALLAAKPEAPSKSPSNIFFTSPDSKFLLKELLSIGNLE